MVSRKLLFVDDEVDFAQVVEQQFEGKINEYDVEFVYAFNGMEALKKLEEHQDIELVLSDINMPVMDGLEFVNKALKLDRLLKIIMVSAYSDMPNIRKAMNCGAYDFIIKPVDFVDLGDTISKTFKQIDQIKSDEAELKRLQNIEKEMEMVKKILASLLPSSVTPFFLNNNFEIFGTLVSARIMGGDFYDYFPAGTNKLAIVIGETEAKGFAAAIYVLSAREAIRKFTNQNPNVEVCIKQINDYLYYQKTDEISNFSLFFGLFDTLTGELEYVCAGLPMPLIISSDGKITSQPKEDISIGFSLAEKYFINKITLTKNDNFIISSKGIYKLKSKDGKVYSQKGFQVLAQNNRELPLATLIDTIILDARDFIAPLSLINDYVVLSLKYKGM